MKQGKMWSMEANGQEQFAPETLASAVYMDETGQKTVAQALDEIELTPGPTGPAGPTGPQGPAGTDATVTKPTVENVLTGNITSHSHTPQHIGAAPASHTHTKANITDFAHAHTPAEAGAAPLSHSHNYAASSSAGGPANVLLGSYTSSGGQQAPNYFGRNRVGCLMMNTPVNGDYNYKDWLIMDGYSGDDVGGGTAIGVDRQSMRAFIMGSDAARSSWSRSAELATTVNIVNLVYPVGSIYMSVNGTNPGSLFGGTWVAWGTGRVPVGINTGDGNFNTVEKTGGESAHVLSGNEMTWHNHAQDAHNHSQDGHTHSQDAHNHNVMVGITHSDGEVRTGEYLQSTNLYYGSHKKRYTPYQDAAQPYIYGATPYIYPNTPAIGYAGASWAHNNLQPYITCYMWKRTA